MTATRAHGGWTRENARHVWRMLRQGRRPAISVYESVGGAEWIGLGEGWLNLGLWEGPGDAAEASRAAERLVEAVAAPLPKDAVVLDVANGLGRQDVTIARVAHPKRLVALNLTTWQLREGRRWLDAAGALPVGGDAARLPVASASVDGIISVEAAFHFPSRAAFFSEAFRVLRPGGVLTTSDVSAERFPRTPREALSGLLHLRFWGLQRRNMLSAAEIEEEVRRAGFSSVEVERCGDRVIDPVIRFAWSRLAEARTIPRSQLAFARFMLRRLETMRDAGMVEYLLIRARRP